MNTKFVKAALVLTIVALFGSACGFLPALGSRNLITEARTVSGYDRLSVSGAGDVTIIQDGTEALTIETDDNVMQYVTTEVKGQTLSIGLDFHGAQQIIPSKLHVSLHVKDLTEISSSGSWDVVSDSITTNSLAVNTSGSGDVSIKSLTADALTVGISGSADMEFAGKVGSQQVTISGSGNYHAGDLQTRETTFTVSGSGDGTVWVTDSLTAKVSGNGTIDYYGSPQVTFNQSGSGDIKALGDK